MVKAKNQHLLPISVWRFVFHMSNPFYRDNIMAKWLIPKGKSDSWLSDTNIEGKVIFLSNNDNPENWFDSWYNDDIYKIDTLWLDNAWYKDPNFSDHQDSETYIITFEPIPYTNIELIYKWDGENTDDLWLHPYIRDFLDKK